MNEPPVFGEYEPDREYKPRPSAYVIVSNDEGHIAVVKTARGCYLPGGGIEPGEDAEAAVIRECLEECGFRPHDLRYVASAVQLVIAPDEGSFRIEGKFYSGRVATFGADPSQHPFEWLDPTLACKIMTRAFERSAILTWIEAA